MIIKQPQCHYIVHNTKTKGKNTQNNEKYTKVIEKCTSKNDIIELKNYI